MAPFGYCCEADYPERGTSEVEVLASHGLLEDAVLANASPRNSEGPQPADHIPMDCDGVMETSPDPEVALTFLRPSGDSEVVKFISTPLCFRLSHTYPYVVTDVAAELELHATSMIQPRWVLTHVNHEKLPEVWSVASKCIKSALEGLPHKPNWSRLQLQPPTSALPLRKSKRNTVNLTKSPPAQDEEAAADFISRMPPPSIENSLLRYQMLLAKSTHYA